MAEPALDEFLSPEGAILREPDQVERALAVMWQEAGGTAAPEADARTVSRVCVANLVVIAAEQEWNAVLEVLSEITNVYPSRTIVVLLDESLSGAAAQQFRASVSALCQVTQPGSPQVCCDQIVLRTGLDDACRLDRTVLPLLESDVPVMTWWTIDPARCPTVFDAMRDRSDRLIIDAGLAGLRYLERGVHTNLRELGWYRTHRWRELIAGLFDSCGTEPLNQIERLTISVGEDSPEVRIAAVWLIAFFAGQLGWSFVSGRPADGPVTSGPLLDAVFDRGGEPVTCAIEKVEGEGLIGIRVHSRGAHFEACRAGGELRLVVHEEHVCQAPRYVHLPRRRRSEALVASLTGRQRDLAFERAAPIAAKLAI